MFLNLKIDKKKIKEANSEPFCKLFKLSNNGDNYVKVEEEHLLIYLKLPKLLAFQKKV
jgi:hypothetical protein